MSRKNQNTDRTLSNINLEYINQQLQDCPDIIRKKVYVDKQQEAFFFYIEGLTDTDLLQRDFINPIAITSFHYYAVPLNLLVP